jgi:hypothetical protein
MENRLLKKFRMHEQRLSVLSVVNGISRLS